MCIRDRYERAGLLRADIDTHYVSSRGFEPPEGEVYLWSPGPPRLSSGRAVTDLGLGLYRCAP